MLKKLFTLMTLTALILAAAIPSYAQAPSQPSAPQRPPGTLEANIPMPEIDAYIGFAIETSENFELIDFSVVLSEPPQGKVPVKIPEGLLNFGANNFVLTETKIEKTSINANIPNGPAKVNKISSCKAKIAIVSSASNENPALQQPKETIVGDIDVKISEKIFNGSQKTKVLTGKMNLNNKKYDLYFNIMGPPPAHR